MVTPRQLLEKKGRKIVSISADASVADAIKMMADHDIGSLLVMDRDKLLGMITERHYARNVFLKGRTSPNTLVGEIMRSQVVCAHEDMSVDECLALLSAKRVRHLPVLKQNMVVGIVSSGDLLSCIVDSKEFIIEQLEHYITH